MKWLNVLILSLTALAGTIPAPAVTADDLSASLAAVDRALSKRAQYIERRQAYIDSLSEAADSTSAADMMAIAEAYTAFNNDSALVYLNRGRSVAAPAEALPFRWKAASLLPLAGFFELAQSMYDSIDPDSIPAGMLPQYYDAGRQMHSYIASFFANYPNVREEHRRKALEKQQQLITLLPPESAEHKFQLGEYYFLTGRPKLARVLLEELMAQEPPASNLRARAAHHLATMAAQQGNDTDYTYYLSQSALADLLSATREIMSLQDLGSAVFAAGDIDRGYSYLTSALATAVECGAPLRMIDSSKSMPIIERAYSHHASQRRQTLYIIMAVLICLLLGLFALMLILRHEMHRMKVLQHNLQTANTVKEIYISQFLQLCSIYMDKLGSLSKIVERKLAAGQADELQRMIKSGKFVEEQSREFYEVFDNAFLHIYPDFVSQVNALLRPDAQIVVPEGELLNTDLRILAFMRLGIEESARIAQILNYSLNTIYSYRNRLKARAIDRDTFESAITRLH